MRFDLSCVAWTLSVALLPAGETFGAVCPEIDLARLQTALKGTGETNVVFFASWCASCVPHLKEPQPDKTVFIAAYDEPDRAEEVATSFKLERPCYTGVGIAEALGIRSLPAKRSLKF